MSFRPGRARLLTVVFGCCLCALTFPANQVLAAQDEVAPLQREADEAKAEDEADQAKGEGFSSEQTFAGRLALGQVVEGRTDIVGLFTMEKGKAYPIKLANEGLLNELKAHDRKTVMLQGKFRNQGKYFVVTAIIPPPAPTQPIGKLGGL